MTWQCETQLQSHWDSRNWDDSTKSTLLTTIQQEGQWGLGELDVHKLCKKHFGSNSVSTPAVSWALRTRWWRGGSALTPWSREEDKDEPGHNWICFRTGFQDSFNYLGLVFAAVDRNVQIGNLGEKHSTKLIDQHLGWEETFGRDLTARSEESLALSTSRLILVFGFVSYMYTWSSSIARGARIQVKDHNKGVSSFAKLIIKAGTWGTCGPSQLIA